MVAFGEGGVILWIGFVVVRFVFEHVGAFSRCCYLGVCLREVFLVRLCWFGVEGVGGGWGVKF